MSFADLVRGYALRISPERPSAGAEERVHGEAEAALRAVLFALADVLPQRLAEELLALLPVEAHVAEPAGADDDAGHFAARVAEHLGRPLPEALERAQIALSVLAAGLEPELRSRVARELPDALRVHFDTRSAPPAPLRHAGVHGHTLADGRPGSERPLSEADGRKR